MRYLIEAPGQPTVEGEYLDEMEARSVVRRSGLVKDMSTVKVTRIDAEPAERTERITDARQRLQQAAEARA